MFSGLVEQVSREKKNRLDSVFQLCLGAFGKLEISGLMNQLGLFCLFGRWISDCSLLQRQENARDFSNRCRCGKSLFPRRCVAIIVICLGLTIAFELGGIQVESEFQCFGILSSVCT